MRGLPVPMRIALAGLFVLLAGIQVVRTAAVAAFAEEQPVTGAAAWSGHPDVLRSVAMAHVGEAASIGRTPAPQVLRLFQELATAEPLAAEPFLVHSAIAQREGDFRRAERLLVQVRDRAPRSAAARFLLADVYFRTGRVLPGLSEMSVLGRLIPGAMQQVVPSLAAYATGAGAASNLRRVLLVYPELEPALLHQLAEDPRNADLIFSIARLTHQNHAPPPWQEKLIRKLVEQGSYHRAYSVWAKVSGVPQDGSRGLFNAQFQQSSAPPPFNWTLESSGRGVAQAAGGTVRVLYYGRDDVILASQMMLLPAGRYRLEMKVAGEVGERSQIGWAITCLPNGSRMLELPLQGRTESSVAGEFAVPGKYCAAQRLELRGVGNEFPQSADFRIGDLQLTRIGG